MLRISLFELKFDEFPFKGNLQQNFTGTKCIIFYRRSGFMWDCDWYFMKFWFRAFQILGNWSVLHNLNVAHILFPPYFNHENCSYCFLRMYFCQKLIYCQKIVYQCPRKRLKSKIRNYDNGGNSFGQFYQTGLRTCHTEFQVIISISTEVV